MPIYSSSLTTGRCETRSSSISPRASEPMSEGLRAITVSFMRSLAIIEDAKIAIISQLADRPDLQGIFHGTARLMCMRAILILAIRQEFFHFREAPRDL